MMPPELHPDAVKAEIAAAEKRATDKAGQLAADLFAERRKRRKWTLGGVFVLLVLSASLVVALVLLFQQGHKIAKVVSTVADVQVGQVSATATGLVIRTQQSAILEQIQGATARGATATVLALMQLDAAHRAEIADLGKKVGDLFRSCPTLPCAASIVNRILAVPIPVPTFTGMAATSPTPGASSTPSSSPTVRASPMAIPSPTLTPALQLQCPVICPHTTP